MNEDLLGILACPVCKGKLRDEKKVLVCSGCRRSYPVQNGICILLPDETRALYADAPK